MDRTILFLAFLPAALSAQAQGTCDTAMPVDVGTYTVATVNGTEVPSPNCASGGGGATHGVWYAYTATVDTSIIVTTSLAGNEDVDTRVHVYVGPCGTLTCWAGDDDNGIYNTSITQFPVYAGNTYFIAFDDRWEATGFDFQVQEAPPLPPPPVGFTVHTLPGSGLSSCIVDMNNDGLDDVVRVGPTTIRIDRQQLDGTFLDTIYTTTPADHPASWSICAGDLDANGYNDLMYGASDGVTFMMANANGTAFTEMSFPEYVFCQRTNMVDINNDGNLDAFSCHDIDANVYYLNDGMGGLTYHQGGLGPDCGNYGSVWLDIDNDNDVDLFVAKCGCDPVDILYRNNGDGTFTEAAAEMGFADTQQSWSSAWADFDNDGDMDVFIGTSSFDEERLLRNDGGMFTDVTLGSGFDGSAVSNIDWVAHDFNNDGWVDVLGYHTLFTNNGDMTFTRGDIAPMNGPVGDLNNDGYLDIQNGADLYINDGGTNHYFIVNTVGTTSNSNGIGARVQITSALGTQIRYVKSGDQFHYMSSLKTYFGLGADTEVTNVTILWPSGAVSSIDDPAIDTTLTVVEGELSTGLRTTDAATLALYPSPATDVLHLHAGADLANRPVVITDATGKEVLRTSVRNGGVDVSKLARGGYILQVNTGKALLNGRFVKQ